MIIYNRGGHRGATHYMVAQARRFLTCQYFTLTWTILTQRISKGNNAQDMKSVGTHNMSILSIQTCLLSTMSANRSKWEEDELALIREIYFKNPKNTMPQLTLDFNKRSHRIRSRNAVKCQIRTLKQQKRSKWHYHSTNVSTNVTTGSTEVTTPAPPMASPRHPPHVRKLELITWKVELTRSGTLYLELSRVRDLHSAASFDCRGWPV